MTNLGIRGTRLMASLVARDETLKRSDNPMRELAISACRTADRVDRLEALAADVDPFLETKSGVVTHPVLVEVRQQATVLGRLVTSLRLPDDMTGKRPQTRPLRGVHTPAAVSSLDRARQSKGGA